MPHWRSTFRDILHETHYLITMGDIRERASLHLPGGRIRRPSIPCIKNYLTEQIRRRNVIGLLGARSATYFAFVDNYQAENWLGGRTPPPPYSGSARTRLNFMNFNESVLEALLHDNEIPLPFNRTGRGVPLMTGELPTGPIRAEPINVVQNFAPANTREFSEPVRALISRIDSIHENVDFLSIIPSELRGYLDQHDVWEALEKISDIITQRAQQKASLGPVSLEEQFYHRMEQAEAVD